MQKGRKTLYCFNYAMRIVLLLNKYKNYSFIARYELIFLHLQGNTKTLE